MKPQGPTRTSNPNPPSPSQGLAEHPGSDFNKFYTLLTWALGQDEVLFYGTSIRAPWTEVLFYGTSAKGEWWRSGLRVFDHMLPNDVCGRMMSGAQAALSEVPSLNLGDNLLSGWSGSHGVVRGPRKGPEAYRRAQRRPRPPTPSPLR